jgi:hypothetical protein
MDLSTVLADAFAEARTLEQNRAAFSVDRVREILGGVAAAAEDYLKFISEDDARLQSGKSVAWLRARFNEWAELGHAEVRGRRRYYRAIVIPRRPDLEAARDAGRRGETRVG